MEALCGHCFFEHTYVVQFYFYCGRFSFVMHSAGLVYYRNLLAVFYVRLLEDKFYSDQRFRLSFIIIS